MSTVNDALGTLEQGIKQLRSALKEKYKTSDTAIYVDVSGSVCDRRGDFRPDYNRRYHALLDAMPDADVWSFGDTFHPGLVIENSGTAVYRKIGMHAADLGYQQWVILTDYTGV